MGEADDAKALRSELLVLGEDVILGIFSQGSSGINVVLRGRVIRDRGVQNPFRLKWAVDD